MSGLTPDRSIFQKTRAILQVESDTFLTSGNAAWRYVRGLKPGQFATTLVLLFCFGLLNLGIVASSIAAEPVHPQQQALTGLLVIAQGIAILGAQSLPEKPYVSAVGCIIATSYLILVAEFIEGKFAASPLSLVCLTLPVVLSGILLNFLATRFLAVISSSIALIVFAIHPAPLSNPAGSIAILSISLLMLFWGAVRPRLRLTDRVSSKGQGNGQTDVQTLSSTQVSDYVRDIVIQVSQSSIIHYINSAFERLLDYPIDDFVGLPLEHLGCIIHPSQQAAWRTMASNLATGTLPAKIEVRMLHKDGREVWLEGLCNPLFAVTNQVGGLIFTFRDITRRKQLEEQTQYQANLLQHVSDAIISTDIDLNIQSWNRAAEKLYGITADHAIGHKFSDIANIKYSGNWTEQTVTEAVLKNGLWEGTAIHYRPDGSSIFVAVSLTILEDPIGNPIGFIGINQDITRSKLAEQKLEQSEYFSQRIIEAIPNILYVYDVLSHHTDYESTSLLFYLGYEPPSAFADSLNAIGPLIHPDDLPALRAKMEEIRHEKDGCIHEALYRIKASNGGWRWFQHWITVLSRNGDGEVRQILGTALDVTTRKWAEDALQQSERDYRGLFEHAHDAILVFDPRSRQILDCNESACRVYGFTREEFVSLPLDCIVGDTSYEQLQDIESLEPGTPSNFEAIHLRKDGTEIELEINATSVEYKGVAAILSINRDISFRKRLQHAERLAAIGKLSASIAHEVNNPLQAIQGALALVAEDVQAETQTRMYVDIAQAEILRITRVINQMREVYRPSQEIYTKVSLNSEIQALMPLIRKRLEDQSIQLTLQLAGDVPLVCGVSDKIRQVLLNLILNALDAMPSGGNLDLVTTVIENYVVAEVKDTGSGVAPEHVNNLFTPFYTTKVHGTGLGLSISRDIIIQHNGKLEITSELGSGTCCCVLLPKIGSDLGEELHKE